jgi:hypothetical protein
MTTHHPDKVVPISELREAGQFTALCREIAQVVNQTGKQPTIELNPEAGGFTFKFEGGDPGSIHPPLGEPIPAVEGNPASDPNDDGRPADEQPEGSPLHSDAEQERRDAERRRLHGEGHDRDPGTHPDEDKEKAGRKPIGRSKPKVG